MSQSRHGLDLLHSAHTGLPLHLQVDSVIGTVSTENGEKSEQPGLEQEGTCRAVWDGRGRGGAAGARLKTPRTVEVSDMTR